MLRFGDLQAKGNGTHGRYRMDFEDFERKVADNGVKLFLLCNPHNPVGRAWTRGELDRVAAICERHGVIVASDEIHEDFARPGHEHVVYASVSESAARSCIVCTAPSKTFNLAGLQTSNVFIPNPGLRKRHMPIAEAVDSTRPTRSDLSPHRLPTSTAQTGSRSSRATSRTT